MTWKVSWLGSKQEARTNPETVAGCQIAAIGRTKQGGLDGSESKVRSTFDSYSRTPWRGRNRQVIPKRSIS